MTPHPLGPPLARARRHHLPLAAALAAALATAAACTDQPLPTALTPSRPRLTMSTTSVVVNSLADDGTTTCDATKCTLRAAILTAPDGATVTFAADLRGTITVGSQLTIDKNLTIQGPGAATLIVSGGGRVRVLWISGPEVTISGLTLADGFDPGNTDVGTATQGGGAIFNGGTLTLRQVTISGSSAVFGGGIFSYGTLDIAGSTISGNRANQNGGGIWSWRGLSVRESTIRDNGVRLGYGGGIYTESRQAMTIAGTTISGNSSYLGGGGISLVSGGGEGLTVTNSTITENVTIFGGGGGILSAQNVTLLHSTISRNAGYQGYIDEFENSAYLAGGIVQSGGTLTLRSSIVAGNNYLRSDDADLFVSGATVLATWSLLGSPNGHGVTATDDNHDLVGTVAAPIDASLGPLANNGGPTPTLALLPGSPAIDRIPAGVNGCGTDVASDQRGVSRPQFAGGTCDMGAFELEQVRTDVTAPVVTPLVSGTVGTNGWYTSTVVVTWTATDPESPVTSACPQTTISADTPGQTVSCNATSAGGATTRSVTIERDATAPTLAPTVSATSVVVGTSVTATPHASDALSGVATQSCGAFDTRTSGVKTVTCTATDNAGNQGTGSATVTVLSATDATTQLRNAVSAATLSPDLRRALTAKLDDALAALTAGKTKAACSAYADFIAQVQAQRGQAIPTATADLWLAQATAIRRAIGC